MIDQGEEIVSLELPSSKLIHIYLKELLLVYLNRYTGHPIIAVKQFPKVNPNAGLQDMPCIKSKIESKEIV